MTEDHSSGAESEAFGETEPTPVARLLGSLADPTRMSLYEFVVASKAAIGRDEAAAAVGVARQTAAYHLDRLAEDGLVEVEFVRRSGRSGPGAGRPAKLYRPSDRGLEVTIPPRRYLLAARLLLEAMRTGGDAALGSIAHRMGVAMGRAGLATALEEVGYLPATSDDGEIRFRNCPFHELAEQDRETTCGMNLELVTGILEGSGDSASAHLEPVSGYCCVRIRREA